MHSFCSPSDGELPTLMEFVAPSGLSVHGYFAGARFLIALGVAVPLALHRFAAQPVVQRALGFLSFLEAGMNSRAFFIMVGYSALFSSAAVAQPGMTPLGHSDISYLQFRSKGVRV